MTASEAPLAAIGRLERRVSRQRNYGELHEQDDD